MAEYNEWGYPNEKEAGGGIYGKITLESEGWSGKVIDGTDSDPDKRKFQFDIEMEAYPIADPSSIYRVKTLDQSYGYTRQFQEAHPVIVGISLEHMGFLSYGAADPNEGEIQFLGWNGLSSYVGAWGGLTTDTIPTLTAQYGNLNIYGYEWERPEGGVQISGTSYNVEFVNVGAGNNFDALICVLQSIGNWPRHQETTIKTDLPIFATDSDLMEYVNSNGTVTDKILNLGGDPEEEYEAARNFRYVWNIYGHNANNVTQYTGYRNYRFYGGDGKICFYRQKPTENDPYTLRLYHYENYTIKASSALDGDDEDYTTISGTPELKYLHKSIQFSSSNYYTKFKWLTDLLIFGSQAQAQEWVEDLIDARSAENFNEVSRAYDNIIDPEYGNPDQGYDNGLNGQSYVHGARMWVMDSSQLNHFFDDIFDPVHIQDLLDGTKLLGDGIQAIQGISYFPIDIDDVARVNGSSDPIKIGSYQCPTATGRYVWNNNKLINCGSVFIAPLYNDFRDYKMKLFLSLPYVGLHEIEISKALNRNLEIFYAVDITTGGCTAHVLFDGISYGDSFDGFMASQRPLTALDQTAYLNSVMGCVSSIVGREAGMISSAKSAVVGGMGASETKGGGVSGVSGVPSGLATSYGAITDLYGLSQAVKSQPMQTRGGFAGCLGFFGNQQIHIITIQSKTVKPSLEQQLVGYPSHISQTVGSFSGFLKCSYFKMAAGFKGTLAEWNEIQEIMQGGIYL